MIEIDYSYLNIDRGLRNIGSGDESNLESIWETTKTYPLDSLLTKMQADIYGILLDLQMNKADKLYVNETVSKIIHFANEDETSKLNKVIKDLGTKVSQKDFDDFVSTSNNADKNHLLAIESAKNLLCDLFGNSDLGDNQDGIIKKLSMKDSELDSKISTVNAKLDTLLNELSTKTEKGEDMFITKHIEKLYEGLEQIIESLKDIQSESAKEDKGLTSSLNDLSEKISYLMKDVDSLNKSNEDSKVLHKELDFQIDRLDEKISENELNDISTTEKLSYAVESLKSNVQYNYKLAKDKWQDKLPLALSVLAFTTSIIASIVVFVIK